MTLDEARKQAASMFCHWRMIGEPEACDFLNDSNRDLIRAYQNEYPNAKGYKVWEGIVDIPTDNIFNFSIDVVFDGSPEAIAAIKKEKDEDARINAAHAANGEYLIWS